MIYLGFKPKNAIGAGRAGLSSTFHCHRRLELISSWRPSVAVQDPYWGYTIWCILYGIGYMEHSIWYMVWYMVSTLGGPG